MSRSAFVTLFPLLWKGKSILLKEYDTTLVTFFFSPNQHRVIEISVTARVSTSQSFYFVLFISQAKTQIIAHYLLNNTERPVTGKKVHHSGRKIHVVRTTTIL